MKTELESTLNADLQKLKLQVINQPRNILLLEIILMTTATIPAILSLKPRSCIDKLIQ